MYGICFLTFILLFVSIAVINLEKPRKRHDRSHCSRLRQNNNSDNSISLEFAYIIESWCGVGWLQIISALWNYRAITTNDTCVLNVEERNVII